MGMFTENDDGTFSWRKFLTCESALIFLAYCIRDLVYPSEILDIPSGIAAIIGGVFVFYFGKASIGYAIQAIKNKARKRG